jgi:hypothetical protein
VFNAATIVLYRGIKMSQSEAAAALKTGERPRWLYVRKVDKNVSRSSVLNLALSNIALPLTCCK